MAVREWLTRQAGTKWMVVAAILVVLGAIGVVVGHSDRTPPRPTPTPTSTPTLPTPTGCELAPTDPPRAWEVPAKDVSTSPDSAKWAERIFRYAHAAEEFSPSIETGVDELPSNDYSVPTYCASDATTTARVYQRPNFPGSLLQPRGVSIPWDPTWRPSDGRDGFVVIIDPATGREWDIWALSSPQFHPEGYLPQHTCQLDPNNMVPRSAMVPNGLPPGTPAFDADRDLCAAMVNIITAPDGQPADIRTYRGNSPVASGGGLQNSAGLTTPAEVASGTIRHAMKFAVGNTMTGPPCPTGTAFDDPAVGVTCGTAVAPAGQHERAGRAVSPMPCTPIPWQPTCLDGMVPEGTRFVIEKTDAQIDAWLTARELTGRTRETMRVFAVALRDYGLIISDSTPGPAIVQVAGGANPTTAAGWRDLGIGSGAEALAGYVTTAAEIRVLDPPTNRCADGTMSRTWCYAVDSGYGS